MTKIALEEFNFFQKTKFFPILDIQNLMNSKFYVIWQRVVCLYVDGRKEFLCNDQQTDWLIDGYERGLKIRTITKNVTGNMRYMQIASSASAKAWKGLKNLI